MKTSTLVKQAISADGRVQVVSKRVLAFGGEPIDSPHEVMVIVFASRPTVESKDARHTIINLSEIWSAEDQAMVPVDPDNELGYDIAISDHPSRPVVAVSAPGELVGVGDGKDRKGQVYFIRVDDLDDEALEGSDELAIEQIRFSQRFDYPKNDEGELAVTRLGHTLEYDATTDCFIIGYTVDEQNLALRLAAADIF
jgi:hypothetical protein